MYLGGREKNRHADKRHKKKKTAVVGIRNRDTGAVRAAPVPETTAARLTNFVEFHTAKGARCSQTRTRHTAAWTTTRRSIIRRTSMSGEGSTSTGRSRSGPCEAHVQRDVPSHRLQHLHRYVDEFVGRLNMRTQDTMSKMCSTVQSKVDKRLTYALLVAPSTLCGRP